MKNAQRSAAPTQQERSEAMVARLLEATLSCLERVGYANLSIALVTAEAGVSRGALFHHFENKLDLAAAAMRAFFDERYDRIAAAMASSDHGHLSVEERIDLLRNELGRNFETSLEIINALRTEEELRARVLSSELPRFEEQLSGYLAMFPEAGANEDRRAFVAVVAAFLRGMFIEQILGGGDLPEAMYATFRKMAAGYLAARACDAS